ncbi:MAG: AI-2E family transporter [Hyphomicrobiales bacterium]|nr:AI-2E family transporter [Hyphomicrobiales bacterium]
MTAVKRKKDEAPPAAPLRSGASLDSGETRAVMLSAVVLAVFLYWIKLILLPFVLAAIVAYICTPLLDWAAARTRWPRILFAIGLFFVLSIIIVAVGAFAVQRIVGEARAIAADLQPMLEHVAREAIGDQPIQIFGRAVSAHAIAESAMERIREWFGQPDQFATLAGYGFLSLMGAFLTLVLLFYFLVSGERVAAGIFWIVPPHRRQLVARIWRRLDPVLLRYFVGVLGVVVYATIAAYIGLGVILGIRHALLLALLTGVLETVPVIGPTAAAVIAGLVSLRTATGIDSILAYALYATLLRLSIDQLVGPVVLGQAAHVHPVLIIFCFLAGGIVLGIPGVILAVPVALVIKSTLATLYGDA